MNPKYKFELSAGLLTRIAKPNYKDGLAIDYTKESGQEFYRGRLAGQLVFQGDDYTFIESKAIDTRFGLVIYITYDGGANWMQYWAGEFWKTDCEFNENDKTASVTPEVKDRYNAILAGMEKEYNLIELTPEITPFIADKRPMVQVYVPGQSVIGCFLSGMWWEQDCEAVSDEGTLISDYYFSFVKGERVIEVQTQTGTPALPARFFGAKPTNWNDNYSYTNGGFTFKMEFQTISGTPRFIYSIEQGGITLWQTSQGVPYYPQLVSLIPVGGGATGLVNVLIRDINVFARYLCDTEEINGNPTNSLSDTDIVPENRNYTRAIGYNFPDTIHFGTQTTATPTQWGLYQPGQYYLPPTSILYPEMFPVARNAWGEFSIWFCFSAMDWLVEQSGRQPFTLRYVYPLASVLSVLLAKVAPGVTFQGTDTYSLFFYGDNPVYSGGQIGITPKSNVVSAGYDQPAQKAPITLRDVLDMLRDCFRCYWWIDSNNRLRIEHILYFRNGGSYSGTPTIGIDLTTMYAKHNGKPWAFGQDKYKFEKPAMAARYQFGWMDEVTQLFEGYPIEISSNYVQKNNIEQVTINKFTSDIDYILLNPGAVSKDGFVLVEASRIDLLDSPISVQTRSTDGYAKLFDYPLAYGPCATIYMSVSVGYADIYYYDSADNAVGQGPRITGTDSAAITIPDEAAYIGVISQAPGATITLDSVYPDYPKLDYYNFADDNGDHILQNAFLSFAWLQEYYAYDMPALDYSINGEAKVALGVKKLKSQEVSFPALIEPDLVNLIKTNLGNGTIEKLSITLLSRFAKATLRYDTEQ